MSRKRLQDEGGSTRHIGNHMQGGVLGHAPLEILNRCILLHSRHCYLEYKLRVAWLSDSVRSGCSKWHVPCCIWTFLQWNLENSGDLFWRPGLKVCAGFSWKAGSQTGLQVTCDVLTLAWLHQWVGMLPPVVWTMLLRECLHYWGSESVASTWWGAVSQLLVPGEGQWVSC